MDKQDQAVKEALASLSNEALVAARKWTEEVTFTYLMRFGVPEHPRDVHAVIDGVFVGGLAWAVATGYATLTDKGSATDEQTAKNVTALDDFDNGVSSDVADAAFAPTTPGYGAYL